MARIEFRIKVKRAAWDRSKGCCEAEGEIYGMLPGVRCGADLTRTGVEYDHIDPVVNSGDASLDNCCCACPACHRHKTSNRDRPLIAKTNHQQDKARGIFRRKSRPLPGTKASGLRKRMNGQVERRP